MNRTARCIVALLVGVTVSLVITSCKTKGELRREQEYERIKQDVREARGTRADLEVISEEVKTDLTRLQNQVEESMQYQKNQNDEIRRELSALSTRIQALEQKAVAEETATRKAAEERSKVTLENGKRLFDEERYDDAIEILRGVMRAKPKTDEARKAHFLLAEAHFSAKDYASAALEFSEYKKENPKDSNVPNAIYRQGVSFKNMGKAKEAKLFFQELVDRYPKHSLAGKAKAELKKK